MDEIPEGLEDLLNSIRGESSQQSSALAIIPKVEETSGEDLVEEEIDERILRLLGLEDVIDIDYDTYKSLLKEKMVASRMTDSQMPTEEVELLTDEYKRVKNKTGRFKTKKKTIRAESFFNMDREEDKEEKPIVTPAGLLPSASKISKTVEDAQEEAQDDGNQEFNENVLAPSLQKIDENIQNILDTLKKQYELERKQSDQEERLAGRQRAKEREAKLEGDKEGKNKFTSVLNTISKPVTNLLDVIKNFALNTLLGSAAMLILDLINDPNKYLNPIRGFFRDIIDFFYDAIQTVIDNVYGGINTVITFVNDSIGTIIDQINNALGLINNVTGGNFQLDKPSISKLDTPQISRPIPDFLQNQPTKVQQVQQQKEGGQVAEPVGQSINPVNVTKGGMIKDKTGNKIRGMGADTQLVAAQPGEIMMSVPAVKAIGADNLLAANAAAGGTNTPKFGTINMQGGGTNTSKFDTINMQGGGLIQGMQGGGLIQGMQGGGAVSNLVISAGHAPSEPNAIKGIPIGSDGKSVQGTQDYSTGVNEWEATRHLVQTMKQVVMGDQNMKSRISFSNITSYAGLSGIPREVEKNGGTQFVDIHFDARQNGRPGVIYPHPDKVSPVDRSMASVFGKYPVSHRGYGVTNAGGTILEVDRIDSPAIAQFLGEVKSKKKGKHSLALANKVLQSMMPGLTGAPSASAPSASAPATVQPKIQTAPSVQTPKAPAAPAVELLPYMPLSGSSQKENKSSMASNNQSTTPNISPVDLNNEELIVIKSIYNIVG